METLRHELELNREKALLIEPQAIGLPARSLNLVLLKSIENSYDAVQFIMQGLEDEDGVGAKTITDSVLACENFVNKISGLSVELAKKLNDPRETFFEASDGNIVECFPALVHLYAEKKNRNGQSRILDVLIKRFGLDGSNQYTLDEIGTYYDVTRERIRQIEAKSVNEIGQLLSGLLQPKKWKVCEQLIKNYAELVEEFSVSGLLVLEDHLQSILESKFGSTLDASYLAIFLEASGYRKLPTLVPGFRGNVKDSWCPQASYSKTEIEAIFVALNTVFDTTQGLSTFEVMVAAKKHAKKPLKNSSLELALQAVKEFEKTDDGVRVKFGYLRSAADKAYRVLYSASEPLHYSKICREINLLSGRFDEGFTPVSESNLTNQLVADDRFSPIGKSGNWTLSTWSGTENITIADALERILHRHGKPMKYSDILSECQKIRPDASEKSVKVYINDTSKFSRVDRGVFSLRSWGIEPVPKSRRKKSVSNQIFATAVKESLDIENPQPFSKLIVSVAQVTGLSEISVRQKIARKM